MSDVRIALGSVAPTVVRCTRTEDLLRDQTLDEATIKAACAMLAQDIATIDACARRHSNRLRVAANLLANSYQLSRTGRSVRQHT